MSEDETEREEKLQILSGKIKKGDIILMEGNPVVVTEIMNAAIGKHGQRRYFFRGVRLFNRNQRHEEQVRTASAQVKLPDLDIKTGVLEEFVTKDQEVFSLEDKFDLHPQHLSAFRIGCFDDEANQYEQFTVPLNSESGSPIFNTANTYMRTAALQKWDLGQELKINFVRFGEDSLITGYRWSTQEEAQFD